MQDAQTGGDRRTTTTPTIEVVLPAALVALFPGAPRHLELSASTVDAMLDEMDARWPGMRDRLCDSRPGIRKHIKIFITGRSAELDTPLNPGQKVYILTAVSGG